MRVIPLIPAILSLILGLSIGLVRFGWEVPLPNYELLIAHSTLMVCGFFGTLICLERSVVIDHPVAYTVPLICGLGVLVQIYIPTHGSGSIFFLAAAVGLLIIYMLLPEKRDAGFYVQVAGAAAWVVGTGCLVATWPSFVLVPWWITGLLHFCDFRHRLSSCRLRTVLHPSAFQSPATPRMAVTWCGMGRCQIARRRLKSLFLLRILEFDQKTWVVVPTGLTRMTL